MEEGESYIRESEEDPLRRNGSTSIERVGDAIGNQTVASAVQSTLTPAQRSNLGPGLLNGTEILSG